MLPESPSFLSGCIDHSTSGLLFQSSSNLLYLNTAHMGGGFENLHFISYSSPGILEEFLFPDLIGMGVDQVGFGWGGHQQPPNDFRISDDHWNLPGDSRSRSCTPDKNVRSLSASKLFVSEYLLPSASSSLN